MQTNAVTERKPEMSTTEHGAEVVLLIDAAKVDETRLKELLRKGVEIEHGGRKLHFSGKMTTDSPSIDVTKDAGETKGREDAEKLPWKLRVIIGGPVLIVIIIGNMGLVPKPRRRLPHHRLVSLKITRTEPVRLMWVPRRMNILPASWIILFPHSTRILHGGMEAIIQAVNLIILDIQSAKSHWKHKRTTIHR